MSKNIVMDRVKQLFALFVIYLFVGSLITVEVIAPTTADSNSDIDYDKPDQWSNSDYQNADYSQVNDWGKVQENRIPVGRYGDSNIQWSQLEHNKLPVENIDAVPADQIKVNELTAAQKMELTGEQLASGNNLEKVGPLNGVSETSLNDALKQKHGLNAHVSVNGIGGVTYKDGKLVHPSFPNGIPITSVSGQVLSITAVEGQGTVGGFEFKYMDKEGNIQTATGAEIANVDLSGDSPVLTDMNGNEITLNEGELVAAIGEDGNVNMVGVEDSTVTVNGAEVMYDGIDGEETTVTFDGERFVVEGPAVITKDNIRSVVEDGKVSYEVNSDGELISIDSREGRETTFVSLGDGIEDRIGSGQKFFSDDMVTDFTLNDGSTASLAGIGLIRATNGPLHVNLQTGNNIDNREIMNGKGAALSQTLKLRHGLSNVRADLLKQLAEQGGTATLQIPEQNPDGSFTMRTATCGSVGQCDAMLGNLNTENLDQMLENMQTGSGITNDLFLVRNLDSNTGAYVMGDAAGTGNFRIENPYYGNFEGMKESSSFFFRTMPGSQALYVDSYEKSPGKFFSVDWRTPVTNSGRNVFIHDGNAYQVGTDSNGNRQVYDMNGNQVDGTLQEEVLQQGREPMRNVVFEKMDGETHAKITANSVLETGLFKSENWNLENGFTYEGGHEVKMYFNREGSLADIKAGKGITNYLEINTDTNRLILAGAVGEFKGHTINGGLDASFVQSVANEVARQREIVGRTVAAAINTKDIKTIVDQLKSQYSGAELQAELARRGITEVNGQYKLDQDLLDDQLKGYISDTNILTNPATVISADIRSSFAPDSAFGTYIDGVSQSVYGNTQAAIDNFQKAIFRGLDVNTGMSAMVDEILSDTSNDRRFAEAQRKIDYNMQFADYGGQIQLYLLGLNVQHAQAQSLVGSDGDTVSQRKKAFEDARTSAERLLNRVQNDPQISAEGKQYIAEAVNKYMVNSHATQFLMNSENTDLAAMNAFLNEHNIGGTIETAQLRDSIITSVYSNAITNELGKETVDMGKVNELKNGLTTHIQGLDQVGSQTYEVLGNAEAAIGNNGMAATYFRRAEEVLGDEAASINYDTNLGFDYADFAKSANRLAQSRIVNYAVMGDHASDITVTSGQYLANSFDGVGIHDNKIRGIAAQAYRDLGDMQNSNRMLGEVISTRGNIYSHDLTTEQTKQMESQVVNAYLQRSTNNALDQNYEAQREDLSQVRDYVQEGVEAFSADERHEMTVNIDKQMAGSYIASKDIDKAIDIYNQLNENGDLGIREQESLVQMMLVNKQDASAVATQVAEQYEEMNEHDKASEYHLYAGNMEQAQTQAEQALSADGSNDLARQVLTDVARQYAVQENFGAAEAVIQSLEERVGTLTTTEKTVYAQILAAQDDIQKQGHAQTVFAEVGREYEASGDQVRAAEAYLAAGENSEALRLASDLEQGDATDVTRDAAMKTLAAQVYAVNEQDAKAQALFEEAAQKGNAHAQLYLAQKAESEQDLATAEKYYQDVQANSDSSQQARELAKTKLDQIQGYQRELADAASDTQVVDTIISNFEERRQSLAYQEDKAMDAVNEKYSSKFDEKFGWVRKDAAMEAVQNEGRAQQSSLRQEEIRTMESLLEDPNLNVDAQTKVMQRLTELYSQENNPERMIQVVEDQLKTLTTRYQNMVALDPSQRDTFQEAQLQESISGLLEVRADAYKSVVSKMDQQFDDAVADYGIIDRVSEGLFGIDENSKSAIVLGSEIALKSAQRQYLTAENDYLATLSGEELIAEQQYLNDIRGNRLYDASTSDAVKKYRDALEAGERQVTSTVKNTHFTLLENPHLADNPTLLGHIVESKVAIEIAQQDIEYNKKKSEQFGRDAQFIDNEGLRSGIIDEWEDAPIVGGVVQMVTGGVEWVADKLGFETDIQGLDNKLKGLQAINEKRIDTAIEDAQEAEQTLTKNVRDYAMIHGLTQDEQNTVARTLLEARGSVARMGADRYQQKFEQATKNQFTPMWYATLGVNQMASIGFGNSEAALVSYYDESTRLNREATAAEKALQLMDQGQTLDQVYKENPWIASTLEGSVDNYQVNYDSTIESVSTLERTMADEIFNPMTVASFLVTSPIFGFFGKGIYGGASLAGKTSLNALARIGARGGITKVVTDIAALGVRGAGAVGRGTMTLASSLYDSSRLASAIASKLGLTTAIGSATLLGKTSMKMLSYAAEEMWFEEMVLPQVYGATGKYIDAAVGTQSMEHFFSETVNNFAEMYKGHRIRTNAIQEYVRAQGTDIDIESYYSPDYGQVDLIKTSDTKAALTKLGLQPKIQSGELQQELIEGGIKISKNGQMPIIITTDTDFASKNSLISPLTATNYHGIDTNGVSGVVTVMQTDTTNVNALAQSVRNTEGFSNVQVDNGIVTATQGNMRVAFAPATTTVSSGDVHYADGSTFTLQNQIDQPKIDSYKSDTQTVETVISTLDNTRADVQTRDVVYMSNDQVYQQFRADNVHSTTVAQQFRDSNQFDNVVESGGRVFARSTVTGNNIIVDTNVAETKVNDRVTVGEDTVTVLQADNTGVFREDTLISRDGDVIKKVEINYNPLQFQAQLNMLRTQGANIEIVQPAQTADDVIVYTQDGQKVVVVQQGQTPEIVDGVMVEKAEVVVARAIEQNIASAEPSVKLLDTLGIEEGGRARAEDVRALAEQVVQDIKIQNPTQTIRALVDTGFVDENLNAIIPSTYIQGYANTIKTAVVESQHAAVIGMDAETYRQALQDMGITVSATETGIQYTDTETARTVAAADVVNTVRAKAIVEAPIHEDVTLEQMVRSMIETQDITTRANVDFTISEMINEKGITAEQIKQFVGKGDEAVTEAVEERIATLDTETNEPRELSQEEVNEILRSSVRLEEDGVQIEFLQPKLANIVVNSQQDADEFAVALAQRMNIETDAVECRFGTLRCTVKSFAADEQATESGLEQIVEERAEEVTRARTYTMNDVIQIAEDLAQGRETGRRQFVPGDDYFPPSWQTYHEAIANGDEVQREHVDLENLPVGSLVYLRGYHGSAEYIIKVREDGRGTMWSDTDGYVNGLDFDLDSLRTYNLGRNDNNELVATRASGLTIGNMVMLPYFNYKRPTDNLRRQASDVIQVADPGARVEFDGLRDAISSIAVITPSDTSGDLNLDRLIAPLEQVHAQENVEMLQGTGIANFWIRPIDRIGENSYVYALKRQGEDILAPGVMWTVSPAVAAEKFGPGMELIRTTIADVKQVAPELSLHAKDGRGELETLKILPEYEVIAQGPHIDGVSQSYTTDVSEIESLITSLEEEGNIEKAQTLERLLADAKSNSGYDNGLIIQDGLLQFNYIYGDNNGVRPVYITSDGTPWITKDYSHFALMKEKAGSIIHNAFGIESPEVSAAEIDGVSYLMTEFIPGTTLLTDIKDTTPYQDMLHASLIPTLLSGEYYNAPDGTLLSSMDRNPQNYLITEDGRVVVIDFAGARPYPLEYIAQGLSSFGFIDIYRDAEQYSEDIAQFREIRPQIEAQLRDQLSRDFTEEQVTQFMTSWNTLGDDIETYVKAMVDAVHIPETVSDMSEVRRLVSEDVLISAHTDELLSGLFSTEEYNALGSRNEKLAYVNSFRTVVRRLSLPLDTFKVDNTQPLMLAHWAHDVLGIRNPNFDDPEYTLESNPTLAGRQDTLLDLYQAQQTQEVQIEQVRQHVRMAQLDRAKADTIAQQILDNYLETNNIDGLRTVMIITDPISAHDDKHIAASSEVIRSTVEANRESIQEHFAAMILYSYYSFSSSDMQSMLAENGYSYDEQMYALRYFGTVQNDIVEGVTDAISDENIEKQKLALLGQAMFDDALFTEILNDESLLPKALLTQKYQKQAPAHGTNDPMQHTLLALQAIQEQGLSENEKAYLRAALMFHDIGKPDVNSMSDDYEAHAAVSAQLAEPLLREMGFNNDEVAVITQLIETHEDMGMIAQGTMTAEQAVQDLIPRNDLMSHEDMMKLNYIMSMADISAIPGLSQQTPMIQKVYSDIMNDVFGTDTEYTLSESYPAQQNALAENLELQKAVIDSVLAQAREIGNQEIVARYEQYSQQNQHAIDAQDASLAPQIPLYYHTSSEYGLGQILQSGVIKSQDPQAFMAQRGAYFADTMDPIYGDVAVAIASDIEAADPFTRGGFLYSPTTYKATRDDIPIGTYMTSIVYTTEAQRQHIQDMIDNGAFAQAEMMLDTQLAELSEERMRLINELDATTDQDRAANIERQIEDVVKNIQTATQNIVHLQQMHENGVELISADEARQEMELLYNARMQHDRENLVVDGRFSPLPMEHVGYDSFKLGKRIVTEEGIPVPKQLESILGMLREGEIVVEAGVSYNPERYGYITHENVNGRTVRVLNTPYQNRVQSRVIVKDNSQYRTYGMVHHTAQATSLATGQIEPEVEYMLMKLGQAYYEQTGIMYTPFQMISMDRNTFERTFDDTPGFHDIVSASIDEIGITCAQFSQETMDDIQSGRDTIIKAIADQDYTKIGKSLQQRIVTDVKGTTLTTDTTRQPVDVESSSVQSEPAQVGISRRSFLRQAATAIAGITFAPAVVPRFMSDAFAGEALSSSDQQLVNSVLQEEATDASVVATHVSNRNGQRVTSLVVQSDDLKDITDTEALADALLGKDIKMITVMTNLPTGYSLVKGKLAGPMIYGGTVNTWLKDISFNGFMKTAGAMDAAGNYMPGYERLAQQRNDIIRMYNDIVVNMEEGSYIVTEIKTNEDGTRTAEVRFYQQHGQQPVVKELDVLAADVLIRMNLVNNPDNPGVDRALLAPIVAQIEQPITVAALAQNEQAAESGQVRSVSYSVGDTFEHQVLSSEHGWERGKFAFHEMVHPMMQFMFEEHPEAAEAFIQTDEFQRAKEQFIQDNSEYRGLDDQGAARELLTRAYTLSFMSARGRAFTDIDSYETETYNYPALQDLFESHLGTDALMNDLASMLRGNNEQGFRDNIRMLADTYNRPDLLKRISQKRVVHTLSQEAIENGELATSVAVDVAVSRDASTLEQRIDSYLEEPTPAKSAEIKEGLESLSDSLDEQVDPLTRARTYTRLGIVSARLQFANPSFQYLDTLRYYDSAIDVIEANGIENSVLEMQIRENRNVFTTYLGRVLQQRISNLVDESVLQNDVVTDTLVQYYTSSISTTDAIGMLMAQGIEFETARLAVGRSYNAIKDLHENGIVGDSIGGDVHVRNDFVETFVPRITETQLENHINRGIWLIENLRPKLLSDGFSDSDIKRLKAMYFVHDIGKMGTEISPEMNARVREVSGQDFEDLIIKSFELENINGDEQVIDIFTRDFGADTAQVMLEALRSTEKAGNQVKAQHQMRTYFPRHSKWGQRRLTQLAEEGMVSAAVAETAWKHHDIQNMGTQDAVISLVDWAEAAAGRKAQGTDYRIDHTTQMTQLQGFYDNVWKPRVADPADAETFQAYIDMFDRLYNEQKADAESAEVSDEQYAEEVRARASDLQTQLNARIRGEQLDSSVFFDLKVQTLARENGLTYLGSGQFGAVVQIDTSRGPVALKLLNPKILTTPAFEDAHVNAILAVQGNPLFQQYVAHEHSRTMPEYTESEISAGYLVTELIPGESFTSMPNSEWNQMTAAEQEAHRQAKSDRLRNIPDSHWQQLVDIFETAEQAGIRIDTVDPANFKYDPGRGFVALDFFTADGRVHDPSTVGELQQSAAIILTGRETEQTNPGDIEYIRNKIDSIIRGENDKIAEAIRVTQDYAGSSIDAFAFTIAEDDPGLEVILSSDNPLVQEFVLGVQNGQVDPRRLTYLVWTYHAPLLSDNARMDAVVQRLQNIKDTEAKLAALAQSTSGETSGNVDFAWSGFWQFIPGRDIGDFILEAHAKGLTHVELSMDFQNFMPNDKSKYLPGELSSEALGHIRQIAENLGISITVHSPIIGPSRSMNVRPPFAVTTDNIELQKAALESAAQMGADLMVFHLVDIGKIDDMADLVRHAETVNNQYGTDIKVGIENYPNGPVSPDIQTYIDALNDIAQRSSHQDMAIVFDTAHANLVNVQDGTFDNTDPLIQAVQLFENTKAAMYELHTNENFGGIQVVGTGAFSNDLHIPVSGMTQVDGTLVQVGTINNKLVMLYAKSRMRTKAGNLVITAEQIPELSDNDIAYLSEVQQRAETLDSHEEIINRGRALLEAHSDDPLIREFYTDSMVNRDVTERAYAFVAGTYGIDALKEHLVGRMVHRKLANNKLVDGKVASYKTTADKVFAQLAGMSLNEKVAYVVGTEIDSFIQEDSSVALTQAAVTDAISKDAGDTLNLKNLGDISSQVNAMVSALDIESRNALAQSALGNQDFKQRLTESFQAAAIEHTNLDPIVDALTIDAQVEALRQMEYEEAEMEYVYPIVDTTLVSEIEEDIAEESVLQESQQTQDTPIDRITPQSYVDFVTMDEIIDNLDEACS